MKRLPSASNRYAPSPRSMKRGVPPTPRKARTGELTPPGIARCASAKSCSERVVVAVVLMECEPLFCSYQTLVSRHVRFVGAVRELPSPACQDRLSSAWIGDCDNVNDHGYLGR